MGAKASLDDLQRIRRQLSSYVEQQRDSEYLQALRNSSLVARIKNNRSSLVSRIGDNHFKFSWGKANVLYDDPAKITSDRKKTELHLVTQFAPLGPQIEHELTIFSPYFIPVSKALKTSRNCANAAYACGC